MSSLAKDSASKKSSKKILKENTSHAENNERKSLVKEDSHNLPETPNIKSIMDRHKDTIPSDHPDREVMSAHINRLHFSGNKLEARRLHDRYIGGSGQFIKPLTKSGIEIQPYSDGTLDILFDEDVSEVLEKAIVLYINSCGYDEILEKGLKAEHKSKKGGMTESGVKAYRRQNPGSKLQTAVTEKSPKGKRAKRRRSFCARMSGVKGPMKDKKGRPTRKALALRRWRC